MIFVGEEVTEFGFVREKCEENLRTTGPEKLVLSNRSDLKPKFGDHCSRHITHLFLVFLILMLFGPVHIFA